MCRTLLVTIMSASGLCAQPLQKVTINYATRTGTSWPFYIAKEAGYFQKYGLDVNMVFAVHPGAVAMVVSGEALMTNYPLEQAMQASSRDGPLVMVGSSYKKSLFALMAPAKITSVRDLKGKRIGVSQLGDAPYNYSVALLAKFGLSPKDVQWVPIGTDVNGRVAALVAGRVDASMITAPVYFKLEQQGYRSLANTSDYDDIYAPTVYLFKRSMLADPRQAEAVIKAIAESIKRFYDDRDFAVKAYIKFNPQDDPADVARVWERYAKTNTFERVPYILTPAVQYVMDHPPDANVAAQFKVFDFRKVVDNSLVDRLVKEGFFEKLFGPSAKTEAANKAKLIYGR